MTLKRQELFSSGNLFSAIILKRTNDIANKDLYNVCSYLSELVNTRFLSLFEILSNIPSCYLVKHFYLLFCEKLKKKTRNRKKKMNISIYYTSE